MKFEKRGDQSSNRVGIASLWRSNIIPIEINKYFCDQTIKSIAVPFFLTPFVSTTTPIKAVLGHNTLLATEMSIILFNFVSFSSSTSCSLSFCIFCNSFLAMIATNPPLCNRGVALKISQAFLSGGAIYTIKRETCFTGGGMSSETPDGREQNPFTPLLCKPLGRTEL